MPYQIQPKPNLFHLRIFLNVYKHRSISATAQNLNRSQPAISQAIHSLEKMFNATLFHRTTKHISSTPAAQKLYDRIQRVLFSLDAFFENLARTQPNTPKNVVSKITSTQLQALQAVADAGSFSGGAAASNKASPTIHRAAKELEKIMEVRLFERTSYGVKPTRTANQLAQVASIMFREIELALAEIAQLSNQEVGNTAIGAMPMARSYIIPKSVSAFKQENPTHNVSIVEGPYEYLLQDLQRGKLDFLIGASRELSSGLNIEETSLFEEPIVLLMRYGHPLAQRPPLPVQEIVNYPWIRPRAPSPLRKIYDQLFDNQNSKPPDNIVECNSLSASRVILESSNTLMLLSKAQAWHELMAQKLVCQSIANFQARRTIALTSRSDYVFTPTQQVLISEIKKMANEEALPFLKE